MKTNKADHFQLIESGTNMTEQLLKGLYHQDLKLSALEKMIISKILNCDYDQVDRWFSSNKKSDKSLSDGDEKPKIKVVKYTADELQHLTDIFEYNPSPKRDEINSICKELKRNYSEVYQWFARRRANYVTGMEGPDFDSNTKMNKIARQNIFDRLRMTLEAHQGAPIPVPEIQWKSDNYLSQLAINHVFNPQPTTYLDQFNRRFLDIKEDLLNLAENNSSNESVVGSNVSDMETGY